MPQQAFPGAHSEDQSPQLQSRGNTIAASGVGRVEGGSKAPCLTPSLARQARSTSAQPCLGCVVAGHRLLGSTLCCAGGGGGISGASLPHGYTAGCPRGWAGPRSFWWKQRLPSLSPVCRIPGQAQQPFSTELFVHSTAAERAFVPTQEGQMTKAIVCLLADPHSLGRETSSRGQRCHKCDHTASQVGSRVGSGFPRVWQGAHDADTQTRKLLLVRPAGP